MDDVARSIAGDAEALNTGEDSGDRLEHLNAWAERQRHGVERVEAEQASAEALLTSAADEIESLRRDFAKLIAARTNKPVS